MKRKQDNLEAMLRRQEAQVPRGLRKLTLKRMGLGPATWGWRPWALAGSGMALALSLTLLSPTKAPQSPVKALIAPAPAPALLAKAPLPSASYGSQAAPAKADPFVAKAEAASSIAPSEKATTAAEAIAAAPAPVHGYLASGQPLTRRQSTVSEFSAAQEPGGSASLQKAGGQSTRDSQAQYRLKVKGNRLRPGLGERLKIELQVTQYGKIHIGLYDSQGRVIRVLAEVWDLQGTLPLEWDGSLANGQPAPSGAYTLLVQSPDKTEKFGVLVIR